MATKADNNRTLATIIVFIGITTAVISTVILILLIRQDNAISAARQAEYRICVRQMVDRAVVDVTKNNDERHLPIYDCTPNLTGHPARRLTQSETLRWDHYVQTAKLKDLP